MLLLAFFLTLTLWLIRACRSNEHYLQHSQLVQSNNNAASDLDSWINEQASISWSEVLKNVSPSGALKGIIVASLSTSKPDYFYSWTRDSAIVMKEIVGRYQQSYDPSLLSLIKQSISATQVIQSSAFYSNTNLGEPKFYVNGSAFTGPWGRPQIDGPALRATVYIKFALAYLESGDPDALNYVKKVLYDGTWKSRSVIKADLEYISNTWDQKSFDLWEEVHGFHFFTLSVICRALKDGKNFSEKMNDPGAAGWYEKQADLISEKLKLFWDKELGYVRASINYDDSHGKKSGLDVGTLLGCLHSGKEIPDIFRPQSKIMMDTFHAILNSMSQIYPINKRYQDVLAKAVGRYPEDIYDGVGTSIGNPWYITTLTMAEYLYRLDKTVQKEDPSIINQSYKMHQTLNQQLLNGLSTNRSIGDQFLTIVRNSISSNGSIHEQFDRVQGFGLGARDLTWSHVAFLSMLRARNHSPEF